MLWRTARRLENGRFEVRARLPSGSGTWPAILILASGDTYGEQYWPHNGEIDIMEHVGFEPEVWSAARYTPGPTTTPLAPTRSIAAASPMPKRRSTCMPSIGRRRKSAFSSTIGSSSPSSNKRAPTSVGGTLGGQKDVADNIWPQGMAVDYVRVNQPSTAIDGKTWGEVKDR